MTDITAIYNYLEEQGIKHSNLGYRYLATSIKLEMDSPESYIIVTEVYEEVAKMHSTSSSCVERAIRNSLSGKKMTNKEFISRAVDKLTVEQIKLNDTISRLDLFRGSLSSTALSSNNVCQ